MGCLWTGPPEEPRRYRVDLVDGVPVNVGGGGEGLVYRAHRTVDGVERVVALKMHTTLTLDDYGRFAERARALSKVDHPNVMHLVDAFVGTALIDDEDPPDDAFSIMYTVAEWIPGLSLPAALEATGPASGLRWVAQVARAAAHLHGFRSTEAPAGLVHRDIKPSNVRVTPDEQAVLIDFGIARPHREGDHTEGAGTYLWRAPEIIGGPGEPGPASDAWGIGALAYWVLLGEPPRLEGAGAAREQLVPAAHGAGLGDPKGLGRHISGLLETHPDRRPGELSRWADEMELRAEGKRPFHRGGVAVIAAAVVVLAGGLAATAASLGTTIAPSPSQSRTLARDAGTAMQSNAGLGSLLSLASYARAPTSAPARGALVNAMEGPLDAILHDGSPISAVAYNGTGTLLASGDSAGNVVLWNTASRQPVERYHVGSPVTSVALSPSGKLVVAGDRAGTFVAWNTAHGPDPVSLHVGREVTAVAFNPTGSLVAIGDAHGAVGDLPADLILWNPATGKVVGREHVPFGTSVTCIAFDPDGSPLVAAGVEGGDVDFWYTNAGRVDRLWLSGEPPVSSITFSADGRTLAADHAGGRVETWQVTDTSKDPTSFLVGSTVDGVAFSPDGTTLAAGDAGGAVTQWSTTGHSRIGDVFPDGNSIVSVVYSPDGRTLATGDDAGEISLWSVVPKKATLTPDGAGSQIDSVAFSGAGGLMAAADYAGDVDVWDGATGGYIGRLLGESRNTQVLSVAIDHDGLLLATGDKLGNVALWDTSTGRQLWVRHGGSKVFSVAFNPSGTLLASGDAGARTILWRTGTGTEVGRPLPDPAKSFVRTVAFSPDGRMLAAGDDGGLVTLWRTGTKTEIGRPLHDAKGRSVRGVAFSPDGDVLAVAADDGFTTLWKMPAGGPIRRLAEHSGVVSVAFSPDGRTLATGDHHGDVVAWNVATGTENGPPLPQHGEQVYSVAFNADGSTLAVANDLTSAFLLPSVVVRESTPGLAATLCHEVQGNLTPGQWARYVPNVPYQKVCPTF